MRAGEKKKEEDTAVKQWAVDGNVNSSVPKSNCTIKITFSSEPLLIAACP